MADEKTKNMDKNSGNLDVKKESPKNDLKEKTVAKKNDVGTSKQEVKESKSMNKDDVNVSKSNVKERGVEGKSDVIEINFGKWLGSVRANPWIAVSVVLAIALIVVLALGGGGSSGVSAQEAGENIVSFINAQGQGTATLVSAEKEDYLHRIVINFDGEEIPVYATLDGGNLVSNVIPVDGSSGQAATNGNVVQADIDDDAVLGDLDAPLTIIEFSDFECPACKQFHDLTYPQIVSDLVDTGRVNYVIRDFTPTLVNPNYHPNAINAAMGAECVRELGGDEAYFFMVDRLFENQGRNSLENVEALASDMGYDISECLESERFLEEIRNDFEEGQAAGVTGTPGFIIVDSSGEGILLTGAQPFSAIKQIVDARLGA